MRIAVLQTAHYIHPRYWFKNIQFPNALPGWYVDPTQYAQHINDAPT